VKNSYLGTPVAEERNDVRLPPAPQEVDVDGIKMIIPYGRRI